MLQIQGTDPHYEALRNPATGWATECKAAFLRLWEIARPFLDSDLPQRAASDLHSVFWEVQLACGLLEAGVSLVPRESRTPRASGPDLLVAEPRVWVEAVIATQGTGPDRVPDAPMGRAFQVPDDLIILRLAQAIEEKRNKRDHYLSKGWLRPSDSYIVAVNSGLVPSGKSELPLPRIVRTVFPFGDYVALVPLSGQKVTEGYYLYRPELKKKSGSVVGTHLFADPRFAGVSACLYSTADAFNLPSALSKSLVLVHNPFATAPLPKGALAGPLEYWQDGNQLKWSAHEAGV